MTASTRRVSARMAALLCVAQLLTPSPAHAEDVASTCADAANAGQPLRRAGRLRAAREQFLLCARDECPDAIRQRCAPWVGEVDAAMPSIVFRARDGQGADVIGLKVWVDGAPVTSPSGVATVVDPGAHRIRYEAPAGQTRDEDVVVAQGEKNRVLLALFPATGPASEASRPVIAPPAGAPRALAYGIGALGVVALGTFAIFEIKAHDGNRDLEDGCAPTRSCAPSALDDVRRDSTVAVVAGGVAVAALAVSVFLLLWRPRGDAPAVRSQALAGGSFRELVGRF